MNSLPPCPSCQSTYTYEDGANLVCPECGHEWKLGQPGQPGAGAETARVYRDASGTILQDGDTVTVIKQGTKVKNIRLVDSDHDIDCKIDGFGAMSLKTEFVRKV
jgi:protein PhnA